MGFFKLGAVIQKSRLRAFLFLEKKGFFETLVGFLNNSLLSQKVPFFICERGFFKTKRDFFKTLPLKFQSHDVL